MQFLKSEETKSIRYVDIAALHLLTEHDDVVTYIYALMQVERHDDSEEKLWFSFPEYRGTIRTFAKTKRILKELRELAELDNHDSN